jgi:dienelactone hydrolase family protein
MTSAQSFTRAAAFALSASFALVLLTGCSDDRSVAATASLAAAKGKPKGAVLIVRDNHGSVDLPARLAASGYTAMAVDPTADLRASLDKLARRAPKAKLGAIGFSAGGQSVWSLLAARDHRLAAAAIVDGPLPQGINLAGAGAAVMVLDSADGPTNAGRPAVEAALLGAGLKHEEKVFMGAREGFFDNAGPQAGAAYEAIVGWFDRYLA